MFVLFDSLAGVLWCSTYILVIVYHYRYHTMAIPPVAAANNLGWETAAFVLGLIGLQPLFWVHVAWFVLDIGIVWTYFLFCKPVYAKRKKVFLIYYVIICACFFLLFLKTDSGMLVSSFVIDLTMALEWFLYFSTNEKIPKSKIVIFICITKLVGDICAWMAYHGFSMTANISGVLAFFLNAGCLIAALFHHRKKAPEEHRK